MFVSSGGEVKVLPGRWNMERVPAVDAAQADLPAGEQGPEQHASGFGAGQQALRLDAPLKLLVQPLDGIGAPDRLPLLRRIAQEGEEPRAGLLQAIDDGLALQPPFAHERLALGLHLLDRLSIDHVGVVGAELVVQLLRRMGQQVAMLVHRAALDRHLRPQRRERRLQAGAPSTMASSGVPRPRATRSSRKARQAASLSPPMFFRPSSTFCPSRHTPRATSTDSPVARLSRRTRTTVPSRMRRTMSSFDRSRFCHDSQSVWTLCQARLTTSLPMAPPNSAPSARRTRRVLVPER